MLFAADFSGYNLDGYDCVDVDLFVQGEKINRVDESIHPVALIEFAEFGGVGELFVPAVLPVDWELVPGLAMEEAVVDDAYPPHTRVESAVAGCHIRDEDRVIDVMMPWPAFLHACEGLHCRFVELMEASRANSLVVGVGPPVSNSDIREIGLAILRLRDRWNAP